MTSLFHLSVYGHLGCFYILAIVNITTVNMGVCISFWISVFVFFGQVPRVEFLGWMVIVFLLFEEFPYCFPQWLHQSAFPPIVHEHFLFSTSSPALVVCRFINDSHSDRCGVTSYCGFKLHFFSWLVTLNRSLWPGGGGGRKLRRALLRSEQASGLHSKTNPAKGAKFKGIRLWKNLLHGTLSKTTSNHSAISRK